MTKKQDTLISGRVKKLVDDFLKEKVREAVDSGDFELAEELQKARRVVKRGAWKIRKPNPYAKFLSECIREAKKGNTLKDAQEAMRVCAQKWRSLSPEERKKWEESGFVLVDYS